VGKMHGKHTRIMIDGYDISGDANSFEPGYSADTIDVSGFSDERKTFVVGLADPALRLGAVYNDAANRIHDVGRARVGSEVALAAVWGTGQGKYGVGGTVSLSEYSVSAPISGAVTSSISMAGGGGNGVFEFLRTLWGKSLMDDDPSGFDTGETPSNAGFSGHLQLIGGSGTIALQSSTAEAGPTWVTRINFGSHSAPYAAYVGTYNGTAPQYLRAVMPSGDATAWCGYKRF